MVVLLLLVGAYVAPAECPGEAEFYAAVARRSQSSTVGLEVEIKSSAGRLSGVLRLDGVERTVEGKSCGELVDALALVASLLLESPEPEPVEAFVPTPAVAAISPISEARVSAPVSWVRPGAWSAGAHGAASSGVVPGLGLGVPLFVQLDLGRGSIRLTGSWAAAKAEPTVGGARFTQLGARLEGCPTAWAIGGGLTLAACGAFEAGVLLASADGVTAARSVAQPLIFGGGLARLAYFGLDPFFVEAEAGALVPFLRPRFVFDPELVVHDVAPVTALVAAGGGLRFW